MCSVPFDVFTSGESLQLRGGQLVCSTPSSQLIVGSDLHDNEWHNATVLQTGATLRCGVDGVTSFGDAIDLELGLWHSLQLSSADDSQGMAKCCSLCNIMKTFTWF